MREDFLVMLDMQPHVIRAGVGMGEVIPRPHVELPARAAYRKAVGTASGSTRRAADYLVGPALDEAERSGEELEIVWPLRTEASTGTDSSNATDKTNGDVDDMKVEGAEDSAAKDNADNGLVQDWLALEALFRYILVTALQLPPKPVNYMILLAVPAYLPPPVHEQLTQMFFESYFIANFLIIERPVVQLYSCAAMTGVVVDVGQNATDVAVIYEAELLQPSVLRCSIGEQECDEYLANVLLEANPDLPTLLAPPAPDSDGNTAGAALEGEALHTALLQLISIMKEGEHIRYQMDKANAGVPGTLGANGQAIDGAGVADEEEEEEEGITDVAKALASGKVNKILAAGQTSNVTTLEGDKIEIQNLYSTSLPSLVIGPERHRFAEPLFNPSLLSQCTRFAASKAASHAQSPSLPEVAANSVNTIPEVEKRGIVWESVVFTGGLARVKGLAAALIASLQKYAADVPPPMENASVQYSRRARHAKTPDYFSEFRERPDLTSFLGASIYAKLGFLESQGGEWMTKQDYNENGPSIATRLGSA
ncbi:actin-like ATPase domain-containing protein [Cystobasidium minutum MCA 4210]|uniref:actin-like ATPase domain-containing protein n=1 Tax=Cystobasidium minutum MCA 4210 TaxID=1397322 RepID=UPI0034CFAA51|eukprot:jgi/Rhomi1/161994/estExt_Genewise1Plus.C_5_t10494